MSTEMSGSPAAVDHWAEFDKNTSYRSGNYQRSKLEQIMYAWMKEIIDHGSSINMLELTGGVLNNEGATYMFGDQFVDANGERFNIQIGIAKDIFAERLKQALGD